MYVLSNTAIEETKMSVLTIRVEEHIINNFKEICKRNDLTASQVIRSAMREYIKTHSQADLFPVTKTAKSRKK
jgi:antitoxin component of RelBE/YafQ-DinJ toxin-antitoxin module